MKSFQNAKPYFPDDFESEELDLLAHRLGLRSPEAKQPRSMNQDLNGSKQGTNRIKFYKQISIPKFSYASKQCMMCTYIQTYVAES
jgi:hypothetical protein